MLHTARLKSTFYVKKKKVKNTSEVKQNNSSVFDVFQVFLADAAVMKVAVKWGGGATLRGETGCTVKSL